MTGSNAKALNAVVAKQGREEGRNRNSNHYQEEGTTMVSRVAAQAQKFDTTIHVGNNTVTESAGTVQVVTELGALSFTSEQALSLAAAVQAVAVHVLEQAEAVAA